ncbi:carboxypeptidase-like regulatory domain-containing protein [Dyadobacter sp. LHD-138]|uniref:carboxypeptidase-like regulatory domain-containing protein n=1 Tax=Dyadobacter sp. LHD-138 TaxID=3071413 RepID=UPI0027E1C67B|nr:carboxypeptidase-like regulatory domain-containing protein [Dyadobacter sp. LHD-138]MDQ6480530.1 carboxypeptidase-like regulatory domain-containing protein [Dyadobacter sp. LHD-138]
MVTGTVVDSQNNQPLPGGNVITKGTTNGTSTDNGGHFSIQTDANTILVFSYVGYGSKEVLPANYNYDPLPYWRISRYKAFLSLLCKKAFEK